MGVIAIASFAGLITTVVLYAYFPLPNPLPSWTSAAFWGYLVLLAAGLVCFLGLLVSGLILLLNLGDSRRGRGEDRR